MPMMVGTTEAEREKELLRIPNVMGKKNARAQQPSQVDCCPALAQGHGACLVT